MRCVLGVLGICVFFCDPDRETRFPIQKPLRSLMPTATVLSASPRCHLGPSVFLSVWKRHLDSTCSAAWALQPQITTPRGMYKHSTLIPLLLLLQLHAFISRSPAPFVTTTFSSIKMVGSSVSTCERRCTGTGHDGGPCRGRGGGLDNIVF